MGAQSALGKIGFRTGILGSAADLAIAAALAAGNYAQEAHTDATRMGWYFDRTPATEHIGCVVMGTTSFLIFASGITVPGKMAIGSSSVPTDTALLLPASIVGVSSLRILPGVAPTTPVDGDVWLTAAGLFAQSGGVTKGPFSAGTGTIGGSIAADQIAYGSGPNTIQGANTLKYLPATTGVTVDASVIGGAIAFSDLTSITGNSSVGSMSALFAPSFTLSGGASLSYFGVRLAPAINLGSGDLSTAILIIQPSSLICSTSSNVYGVQMILSSANAVLTGFDVSVAAGATNGGDVRGMYFHGITNARNGNSAYGIQIQNVASIGGTSVGVDIGTVTGSAFGMETIGLRVNSISTGVNVYGVFVSSITALGSNTVYGTYTNSITAGNNGTAYGNCLSSVLAGPNGTAYGFYAQGVTTSGGGTAYGIYISGVSGAGFGNAYGIYQADGNPVLNYFAAKTGIGNTPVSTSFLTLGAATTGVSSLNIAPGAAPTAPVDGDVWLTSAGLFARISGVTVGPYNTGNGTITGSIAADQIAFGAGPNAIQGAATLKFLPTTTGLTVSGLSGSATLSGVNISSIASSVNTAAYGLKIATVATTGSGIAYGTHVSGITAAAGSSLYGHYITSLSPGTSATVYGVAVQTISSVGGQTVGFYATSLSASGGQFSRAFYVSGISGSAGVGFDAASINTGGKAYGFRVVGLTGAGETEGLHIESVGNFAGKGISILTVNAQNDNAYGVKIASIITTGAEGIAYGTHISTVTGAAGTGYGIYITGVTGTTGAWGIYQNDTGILNFFGSKTGIVAAASTTTALNLPASTVGVSSLRIAHGVSPTAPVDGDVWTTTTGVFARINGATQTLGAINIANTWTAPQSFSGIGAASVTVGAGGATLTTSNYYARYNGAGGDTITLPAANAYGAGKTPIIVIKNIGTGNLIVNRAGSDTIDTVTNIILAPGQGITVLSNGVSAWESN